MLGSDKAGPASSSVSAGPCPIPLPSSPWTMGTSVSVAKYMNAPMMLDTKFARRLSPPTAVLTQAFGIQPSWSGRPSSNPETRTPPSSNGRICLASVHEAPNHSAGSPSCVLAAQEKRIAATAKTLSALNSWSVCAQCSGRCGHSSTSINGAAPARPIFHAGNSNQATRRTPSSTAKAAVTHHFARKSVFQKDACISMEAISERATVRSGRFWSTAPSGASSNKCTCCAFSFSIVAATVAEVPSACRYSTITSRGAPQLAKTSTPTSEKKKRAFFQSGRLTSGSGIPA